MTKKLKQHISDVIDIQFDVAASVLVNRMEAFKAKEECKSIVMKVFEAVGATDYADFSIKMNAWSSAIIIMRAPNVLAIQTKEEMTAYIQTALLEALGIVPTETEREAYRIYASTVSIVAGRIIQEHIRKVLHGPA